MRADYTQLAADAAATLGLSTEPPDLLAATVPVMPVPQQLAIIIGQSFPDPEGQWVMSNNALFFRLLATMNRVAALELGQAGSEAINAAQEAMLRELANGQTTNFAQLTTLGARLDLLKADTQSLAAGLAANQTAMVAAQVRLLEVEAKAQLTASATEANRLAIAQNAATDALRDARLSQDEAAIAAAQATADTAKAAAAAAQLKANQDADAIAALQTQLAQAQATATAAQQAAAKNATDLVAVWADLAKRLPSDAVRRGSVPTPLVSIVVGPPQKVPVVFATPMAGADYELSLSKPGAGLLGVELGWENKTVSGFTLTMRNTGLATLVVPASTADYFAIR